MVRDYLRAFRFGHLRKMWKEQKQLSAVGTYVALFPAYTILGKGLAKGSPDAASFDILLYLVTVLPIILIQISAALHPVRLPKNMYLCPMTAQERKDMIYRGYFFRIGLHMVFAGAGLAVCLLFGQFDVIMLLEYLANSFVVSILSPTVSNAFVFLIPTTFICHGILAATILDGKNVTSVKIAVLITLVFIELPLVLRYIKSMKCEMEAALYYEDKRLR